MPGPKTNEREGTRAVLRHARMSPYKVRQVLDLVRGRPVHEAEDILRFSEREAAALVGKLLRSAVANAENNDQLDPEELYVASCYADEGTTIKRWRPRARGRATRIRKRTSHVTVIVARMEEEQLERLRARRQAEHLAQRARRVAGARKAEGDSRPRAERRRRGAPSIDELAAEEEELQAAEAAEAAEPTDTAEAGETATDTAEAAETAEAGESATDTAEAAEPADTAEAVDAEATVATEEEAGADDAGDDDRDEE